MAFINIPGNPNWEYDNDPPNPGGAQSALWSTGTNGIRINSRGEEVYMNCRHKIIHGNAASKPNEISKTFWDGFVSYFFDEFTDAKLAYSLRKLGQDSPVNALRIRRSTDNVEVYVGYDSNNEVSTSSPITNVSGEPVTALSLGTTWSHIAGASGTFGGSPLNIGGTYATPFRARLQIAPSGTIPSGTQINIAGSVSTVTGSNWVIYPAQSDNSIASTSSFGIASTGVFSASFTLNADAAYIIIENSSGSENFALSGNLSGNRSVGDTAATTLGAFIAEATSPDMHVVTWYDQSGAGKDFINLTTSTQPKIVDSGSYLGYIDYDSNTEKLSCSSITNVGSDVYSYHQVLANQNSGAFNIIAWQGDFSSYWFFADSSFTASAGVGAAGAAVTLGQFNQFSVGVGGVVEQLVVTKNNAPYASTTLTSFPPAAVTSLELGNGSSLGLASEFKIKELVFLGTDTTANNSAVAQNQIAHFGTPN